MAEGREYSAAHMRCASFILEMIEKYGLQICTEANSEENGTKDKVRLSEST